MCTGIGIKANNGGVVYGRTMEFGQEMDSKILMVPRNYAFIATAPSGDPGGLSWKSKYAVVGANALNQICFLDGVNEQGLAGGLFYFSGYAQFQEVQSHEISKSIAPWELITWILTNFATIEQVRAALPTIKVSNAILTAWGITPPVHAIVHDVQGNCLVIEYVNGQLHMFDNPLRVVTNAPTFDWHSTNLKNYITLTANNYEEKQLGGITFAPLGNGSGMLGLPGDFTSPSRFIRAVAFSQSVVDIKTEFHALDAVFHVLNLFNIPIGIIRERLEGGTVRYDYTQWTSACDLHNKRYFFNTYANPHIHMVDLMSMDIEGTEFVVVPMQSVGAVEDITPR